MRVNNRPVINIDLDNVVYPFDKAMASLLGKEVSAITSWEMWNDWDMTKGEFMRNWRDNLEHVYKIGLPIKGSSEALWELSEQEFHIRIITDRLNHFDLHRTAITATVEWLDAHKIPYRSIAFDPDKTHSALFLVDDKPSNVDEFNLMHGGGGFLFGARHNQSNTGWDDVLEVVLGGTSSLDSSVGMVLSDVYEKDVN